MLLSRSSSSFTTVLAMVLLSVLAMLATTPMTAEAGCTYECAGISAKILVCGNVLRNGITDELPTIGVDSSVDNCLCTQDNVRLLRKYFVTFHLVNVALAHFRVTLFVLKHHAFPDSSQCLS